MKTCLPAKIVLAGEHTVVRGGYAYAMPYVKYNLCIKNSPSTPADCDTTVLLDLGRKLKEHLNWVEPEALRNVTIESSIPMGAGLGSSAALCAAVVRFFEVQSHREFTPAERIQFSQILENTFHGKSSGMDVAAVLSGGLIRFSTATRAEPVSYVPPDFLNKLDVIDTGLRASTAQVIQMVEASGGRDAGDRTMTECVRKLSRFFTSPEDYAAQGGLAGLCRVLQETNDAYRAWGLIPESIERTLKDRVESGEYRALRMMGKGLGGFLLGVRV